MVIDIIFVITAIWGFYLGFSRGIIKTVFTILSLVFGLMAAFKFAPAATDFLESTFNNNNPLMFLAGFLLSFVVTMLVIRMIAKALEGILKTANINIINQILGGVLVSGILIVVYSTLLWFGSEAHIVKDAEKEDSRTYVFLKEVPEHAKVITGRLKPVLLDFWDHSVNMMDRMEKLSEKSEGEPEIYDIDDEDSFDR